MPDWERKLHEIAKQTLESERPPGQFFSTKSGVLTFNKIPLNGNEMNVVVTAQIFENAYYPEAFDAGKITAPTCYAFAVGTEEGMAPHAMAHKPQSPLCHTCAHAKFGTATTGSGKGKACRNLRRLCVIPAGNAINAEATQKATAGFIRLPVFSVIEWAKYVRELSLRQRTPLTVVTKMKLVPDQKAMFKFVFEFVSDITDRDVMEALVNRHTFDEGDLQQPYPAKDEGTAVAAPAAAQQAASKF
jgi:hypothetical protein